MFGIQVRSDLPAIIDPEPTTGINPPSRSAARNSISVDRAVTIPAVYRSLAVLTTAGEQLSLDTERGGEVMPASAMPALVRRPSLDMTRSEWLSMSILSLATSGECWLHAPTSGGIVPSLDILPSSQVSVGRDSKRRRVVEYEGKDITAEVRQLCFMRLPGRLRGIGPIQAAREGLSSMADMRDYLSGWWTGGPSTPPGVLSSEADLNGPQARRYRDLWNGIDPDTHQRITDNDNPSGIKVLGKGLAYEPTLMSPKDLLWIEAQNYNTVEVARLWGIPSSLMLTSVEGSSRVYANVEQEWIAFVRFTLMAYLRRIEDALTEFTPRGQTVRFNLETLLRADTKTRYEAHAIAISNKWMDAEEVRAIENLPARPIAQGAPA